jgi:GT2 family glycosyltransferase
VPDPQATGLFDAHYHATGCGRSYQRDAFRLQFFGAIADRIISDIGPATVLDAGCALGFLVEALRVRGVEAYGVDVSPYAIESVHESARPYCWVGSVVDPLPRRYDLIVSIEVLEHMRPDEARSAIANFCQHTDDVLLSSTPYDYEEITHFNVQPPEYWGELFAQNGFFRDVDFDASFITAWATRFRRSQEPLHRTVRAYERAYALLRKETQDLRALALELRIEQQGALDALRAELSQREALIQSWELRWARLQRSPGGTLLRTLQSGRARLAPLGSTRDRALEEVWRGLRTRQPQAFVDAMRRVGQDVSWRAKALRWRRRPTAGRTVAGGQFLPVDAVASRPAFGVHQATVEIIVCVHNALADVQRCLESVVRYTSPPYALILVDDGSDTSTRDYLVEFSGAQGATLLRNEHALGYTFAANQGLRHSRADYVVLLNSDTIVTPEWLDRMISCAESRPQVGLVGPLSNAATWQSIPEIQASGDWALNTLPEGVSVVEMGELVAQYTAAAYPSMPFLNGFCLLIRRQVIEQIGYFDEETFGPGYGEENDYCLRARQAGWQLALADDAYVYHAQSKSYTDEARRLLCERADAALARKHGAAIIHDGVSYCRDERVLQGLRAHCRVSPEQHAYLRHGSKRFAGRRILFLLPVSAPGGGGSVVIFKAQFMRQMGVEVALFNLEDFRTPFEQAYPALDIPVVYGQPEDVVSVLAGYDAVVATMNTTIPWLLPAVARAPDTVRGYFIQDFEPYFYSPNSGGYKRALASYSLIPGIVRFATSKWIQDEVSRSTGMSCALIGPSFDVNLFRPRPRPGPEWPDRPLRITAMIRPETPYRAPRLTMEVLRSIEHSYGARVDVRLFGTAPDHPGFLNLPRDFRWRLAGKLSQRQVASILNETDIFVDFSTFQGLGLTAQEAMACGAATIVPAHGGTSEFARHEQNCLVVDTASAEACESALRRLIDDNELRSLVQQKAMFDVCAFYPERPAYNILDALFASANHGRDR